MIITLIVNIILIIVNFLLSFLPLNYVVNAGVASAFSSAGASLWTLHAFIPIDILFTAVFLVLMSELFILQFYFWRWVVSHLPWIGGRV